MKLAQLRRQRHPILKSEAARRGQLCNWPDESFERPDELFELPITVELARDAIGLRFSSTQLRSSRVIAVSYSRWGLMDFNRKSGPGGWARTVT